jgi:hypothetical protein
MRCGWASRRSKHGSGARRASVNGICSWSNPDARRQGEAVAGRCIKTRRTQGHFSGRP